MNYIKYALLRPLLFWFRFVEKKYKLVPADNNNTGHVVMGFQRSGTSLVCDILNKAGIYFGEIQDMKTPDRRNPNGFFEHNKVFTVSRKFLAQARWRPGELPEENACFKARGLQMQIKRIFTKVEIMRTLQKISNDHDKWAIKNFPSFFYFWKQYIPTPKVIGVYRHPITVAKSFMDAWPDGAYTFDQVITYWTRANKDLLYHVKSSGGILVRYEDLLDDDTRLSVLDQIIEFIEVGDRDVIRTTIDHSLNRSASQTTKALMRVYPLSEEAKKILAALDGMRIR